MKSVNQILWFAGVALQTALLVALLLRGLVRRFPLFTLLIAFYTARSLLLFLLAGRMAWIAYDDLYRILSWADVVLQLLVIAEIATLASRGSSPGPKARKPTTLLLVVLLGIALAAVLSAELPRALSVDRASALTALLMVLLFLWMLSLHPRANLRRIAEGFAVYGSAAIAAQLLRTHAALHRNPSLWRAAAYAQSAVYLAVVLFWLIAVRRPECAEDRPAQSDSLMSSV